MAEHDIVKPEKIAATAAVLLEQNLTVPGVFQREGIDQFRGADDDTVTIKVPGVLPYRTYGWRNDRSTDIQFDTYAERKIAITFGGDAYSAVHLTDEQANMDFDGWGKLSAVQAEAVGRGINYEAADYLMEGTYEVTLGIPEFALRWGLIQARNFMNRMQAPGSSRTILVGTDWETALLEDKTLQLAQNVGESEAVSALREASLGRRYGFNFVVSQEIDPTDAYALVPSAFVFMNAAPAVPQSIMGASASHNGVALRWIRDYDTLKQRERSVFTTYKGFRQVTDVLVGRDADTKQAYVGAYEHNVRAIKLVLAPDAAGATAATVVPVASGGTSDDAKKATEFAKITRLTAPVVPASGTDPLAD